MSAPGRRVSLVTLGCARNEVDSEELAGRLNADGWTMSGTDDADVLVINTCAFVESAKKDSIDTLLAAADTGKKVVAVGCLAERYGAELADSLPEADAVLGFDSYADIAARLDDVAAGRPVAPHRPRDRRALLPISPAHRPAAAADVALPGHAWLPTSRTRLDDAPFGYVKLASGCDRRCTFCAIPSFRGSFVSRPPQEVLAEARWLGTHGVREIVLVSENSTSYGKDLGDLRALETLLPQLAELDGIDRVRVSYLQPAELRPGLLEAIATTPGVAAYFDLSFQHASATVLRRMRRFGSTESFVDILERVRTLAPEAGARSNVIVGFPGETEDDVAELERFLIAARLDVVGVFGYSDEDGTDAAGFDRKLGPEVIAERVARISSLAEELMSQRADDRIGSQVEVLVEQFDDDTGDVIGRAEHQGPDVDGTVRVCGADSGADIAADSGADSGADIGAVAGIVRGQVVPCTVVAAEGIDLVAKAVGTPW